MTNRKYAFNTPYWLPVMAVLMAGCAAQPSGPGQRVSGLYTYEIDPSGATLADETLITAAARASRSDDEHGRATGQDAAASPAVPAASASTAPAGVDQRASASAQASGVTASPAAASSSAPQQQVGQPVQPDSLMAEGGTLDIKPGQCWVYAQIQPKPVQQSVQVKVRDSETRLSVTPAEFRRGFKTVVTKEGTKTYRVKPPVYRTVTERVLVKPESKRLVVEPAEYREIQKEVVLEEGRTELEPCRTSGAAAYGRAAAVAGFCAKDIPAKTRTMTVTELVKPERTRTEVVPAQYKTVTRRVVDKPAEVIPVETQDEIAKLEVAELVKPPSTRQTQVPAKTVSMNVLTYQGESRVVARQAVCDRNLTRDMVRELQGRLAALGYNPGEKDGFPGPNTLDALSAYQVDHGLATGAITLETARKLNLMK